MSLNVGFTWLKLRFEVQKENGVSLPGRTLLSGIFWCVVFLVTCVYIALNYLAHINESCLILWKQTPPGLAIQILDFKEKFGDQMVAEHSVSPRSIGGDMEGSGIGTVLPGLGAMMNYHPTLHNVVFGGAKFDPILDRYVDPGAGGFTAYHDVSVMASKEIKAGEELFTQVSDDWFYSQVPRLPIEADYKLVDQFMKGLYTMYVSTPDMSETAMRDILRRAKFEILSSETWKEKPMVSKLVPQSIEKLKHVYEQGSAKSELADFDLNRIISEGKV